MRKGLEGKEIEEGEELKEDGVEARLEGDGRERMVGRILTEHDTKD